MRLPVYPKIDYNGGYPACSPLPYPVGSGPAATCTPTTPMSAADYDSKVLKPAVDYATSKGLYVIIDHHQIDNATTGTSAADATTFWTDVAPQFASYSNVFYEPFNEPIDGSAGWSAPGWSSRADRHHSCRCAQQHHRQRPFFDELRPAPGTPPATRRRERT